MAVRPKWVDILCALDAVAAALLSIAGVYLIDPTIVDTGWYLEPGRYSLVGGFLIYSAAVLLHAALFGAREGPQRTVVVLALTPFGTAALMGIGAIHLILAYQALFTIDPPRIWIALLAFPGLLAIASSSLAWVAAATSQEDAPASEATSESGKVDPRGVLREHVWAGVIGALANTLLVAFLGAGILVYYLLTAILIDDVEVDLGYLIEVSLPAMFENLWPLALGLALLVLILMPVIGVIIAVGHRQLRRQRPDVDRDLSSDEIAFVARCGSALQSHIEKNGYRKLAARMGSFDVAWFLGVAAAVFLLVIEAENIVAAIYTPRSPGGWSLYVVDSPFMALTIILLAVSWVFAPAVVTSVLSRRLAEVRTLLYKRALTSLAPLQDLIIKLVRRGELSASQPFDPGAFLKDLNAASRLSSVFLIAAPTAIVLWMWPHDRAMDALYTPDGVETGDFWSMERTTYAYSSVESVDLGCRIDSSGSTRIAYTLNLPDGRKSRLVSKRDLADRLDELLRVDEALRLASIKFMFATPFEAASQAPELDPECVRDLAEDMDEAVLAKLERLFHIEEWHERRWRQRISAPQISTL